MVWVCEAISKAGPDMSVVAATCLMARRATISFQALSLNAPKNWAMSKPRIAPEGVELGEVCAEESVTRRSVYCEIEESPVRALTFFSSM